MIRNVDGILTGAQTDTDITALERDNRSLARKIAQESIVLLENDGILPLKNGCAVSLFGKGSVNTITGGSGSSEVNARYKVSIRDGLESAGITIENASLLKKYERICARQRVKYEDKMKRKAGIFNFSILGLPNAETSFREPPFPDLNDGKACALTGDSRASAGNAQDDTARQKDICIYVIGRESGEGADRRLKKGDYFLTDNEVRSLRWCASRFRHLILILNTGGPVSLSEVEDITFSAVLYIGLPGEEAGNAVADILLGKVSPSGHLTSTWPERYEDVPFSVCSQTGKHTFKRDEYTCRYGEGIFCGYRYYDISGIKPRYWFGNGLSYTTFSIKGHINAPGEDADRLTVQISAKNTGSMPGKYLAQIYMSAPEGKLTRERSSLIGFAKSRELKPGEEQILTLDIPFDQMSSFSEELSSYILEKGLYTISLGESPVRLSTIGKFVLKNDAVSDKREHICIPAAEHNRESKSRSSAAKSAESTIINALRLARLLVGAGGTDSVIPRKHNIIVPGAVGYTASCFTKKGLRQAVMCDGTSGLRLASRSVIKRKKIRYVDAPMRQLKYIPASIRLLGYGKPSDGTALYTYATEFPCAASAAQTWNTELIQKMGDAVGAEMEEYGVDFWLAPGMNIQREPLCGRNFEYFSEDPLLSGKLAAALVRGVQSRHGRYAVLKHFACNNREDNRQRTDVIIGERALREIYLKGFKTAITEGGARAVMTGYNRINGTWCAVNSSLLQKYLRRECGFTGIIMSDWDNSRRGCEAYKAIASGVDLLMPGNPLQLLSIRLALARRKLSPVTIYERSAEITNLLKDM